MAMDRNRLYYIVLETLFDIHKIFIHPAEKKHVIILYINYMV